MRILLATALTAIAAQAAALACSASSDTAGFGGGSPDGTADTGPGGGAAGGFGFDGGNTSDGAGEFVGDPKTCEEAAYSKSYVGCDFWPTVVANNVWEIFDYAVVVANAGDQPADVTVTRGGATEATATILPNSLQKLYLPWVSELKGEQSDACGSSKPLTSTVRVPDGAYHLVTTRPVTVYQFNALEYRGEGGPSGKSWSGCPGDDFCPIVFGPVGCFSFSNDASLLLPSTAMTGNYRITGQAGWEQASMGAYFAITGTQDGTTVNVYVSATGHMLPGGGLAATPAGGKATLSLAAGEVVQVVAPPQADLSGSLVQADKPVQVITGIPCVQAPIGSQACDHIEESVFPAETLGKRYFVNVSTAPGGEVVGHIVRIYGNVDGTTLSYPGVKPDGAPSSIDAGEVVDLEIVTENFEITGDHEFAVGSFMLGASLLDPDGFFEQMGDPAQSLATAVEQYRDKYVFLGPDDYDETYVDVTVPDGAMVTIDGAQVDVPVQPISSGFGIARVPLGPGKDGAHVLTATAPVGLQVMGYGSFTSYQYPGGLNLNAIAPPPVPE